MIVQGGAYGEHICEQVSIDGRSIDVQTRASAYGWRRAPAAG